MAIAIRIADAFESDLGLCVAMQVAQTTRPVGGCRLRTSLAEVLNRWVIRTRPTQRL